MRRLEVTFVNYDGAMLQRSLVDFGETPEYTGKRQRKLPRLSTRIRLRVGRLRL